MGLGVLCISFISLENYTASIFNFILPKLLLDGMGNKTMIAQGTRCLSVQHLVCSYWFPAASSVHIV